MAVTLIVGKPGAGKSYETVKNHILPAIEAGRKVVTNIPLNVDNIKKKWPMIDRNLVVVVKPIPGSLRPFSNVHYFTDDWQHEDGYGTLFVVDEAHEAFPRNSKDQEILELFTMHRHRGIDIILVTQQVQQVRRDLIGLCKTVYELANNSNIGLGAGSYRRWVKDGYGKTAAVMSFDKAIKYDKKIFEFYSSYTQGGHGEKKKEARSIYLHPVFLFMYAFAFAFPILFFYYKPWQILIPKTTVEPPPLEEVQAPPPASIAPTTSTAAPSIPAPANPAPVPQVQKGEVLPPPPAAPEPPPEPVEPVYDDGDLMISNVSDFQAAASLDKCHFLLRVNGRMTEMWEWRRIGWNTEYIFNKGEDAKKYGLCTLRMTRGEEPFAYEMQFYMSRLEQFGPPRRFSGSSVSSKKVDEVKAPDIVEAINDALPFSSSKKEEKSK